MMPRVVIRAKVRDRIAVKISDRMKIRFWGLIQGHLGTGDVLKQGNISPLKSDRVVVGLDYFCGHIMLLCLKLTPEVLSQAGFIGLDADTRLIMHDDASILLHFIFGREEHRVVHEL